MLRQNLRFEIVIDHSETANKCTILPLSYRDDFEIKRFRRQVTAKPPSLRLKSQLLLHPDGIPAQEWRKQNPAFSLGSIAAIDCIWRRLAPIMDAVVAPVPELIGLPAEIRTAYPRQSRHDFDPDGGLATIEALFTVSALLGHCDLSLLSEYFFGEKFLQLNRDVFANLGVEIPEVGAEELFKPRMARNSHTRRLGRGRVAKAVSRD